ncbi:bifunctional 4-hydroxy-2-oxoglutarate aldolase/2-dehydro-3-deoxy-phosphogluconate aldolase [Egicoccus sp. AB-alg6-2]|uniref:bifunctional 4-hydroxy-2-oxoglutarate aldolase/2-dehydro-3-deoxy-phosphogluconate aldolase n=1 Tax=Egicoccus sp. AB-alg6-2 TaxID=3242692 RepID=UPI00359E09B0
MTAVPGTTEVVDAIGAAGIVAVVRTDTPDDAVELARACAAGGIRAIEITFTIPDGAAVLRTLGDEFPAEVVVGAGTVLTDDDLEAAAAAGARFAMSPTVDATIIESGDRLGVAVVPGALTPTEVGDALRAGAPAIKIFPAATVGTAHLSALRQVFPGARLVPTGGVEPDSIRQWRSAGAFALGIGGALNHAMRHGGPSAVHELADHVAQSWAAGNTSPLGGGK